MMMNELLLEKYRAQKALDEETGHSLPRYVAETHRKMSAFAKAYGLHFSYGIPSQTAERQKIQQDIVTPISVNL